LVSAEQQCFFPSLPYILIFPLDVISVHQTSSIKHQTFRYLQILGSSRTLFPQRDSRYWIVASFTHPLRPASGRARPFIGPRSAKAGFHDSTNLLSSSSRMANLTCPPPFLDASWYPSTQGYTGGRLCATIPLPGQVPGAQCCLPCPLQAWVLEESSLRDLHVNDIINVIGIAMGSFALLVSSSAYFVVYTSHSSFSLKTLHIGAHWESLLS